MTRRLLLTYLSFALLILVGLELPLGYVYARGEEQHSFEQLEHDAEVLAAFVDSALNTNDLTQVDLLAHESARTLGGQVDVIDAAGTVLSSTHPGTQPAGELAAASDIRAVLRGQGRVSTRMTESGGARVMSVAVPVHPGVVTQGALRVSVPASPMRNRVRQFWLVLAAVGAVVLAAAGVIAFALARWISRPVRALEQATRQLAEGTAPARLPVTGPPELQQLAATFAATANRLQALLASQRSFVGHASHQLKTPLAALRLRLENLEPDLADGGERHLQAALSETDRLARMVETLLSMARSEQSALPLEPVALAAVVTSRVRFWTPLAAGQDVRVTACGPDDARVWTVPGGVEQIVDNLLSNALRVAPCGSTVAVTWQAATEGGARMVELHVVDEGPGLTQEQRVRALEPFWRAPGAAKGGTGLGLSLVRALAGVSGGETALRSAGGNGVDAMVTFPAEPVDV